MTLWLIVILAASLLLLALWRLARLDKAKLQLVAASLLVGLAGYAWQGHPSYPGQPVPPPERSRLPQSEFSKTRGAMLASSTRLRAG